MNKAIDPGALVGLSVNQYAASRESAQAIVANQVTTLGRELAAWQYLQTVMEVNPPTKDQEEALVGSGSET